MSEIIILKLIFILIVIIIIYFCFISCANEIVLYRLIAIIIDTACLTVTS